MINFSIVICSYNPDPTIFKRLLSAVESFGITRLIENEVIIVDNNSSPDLANNLSIISFLDILPTAFLIKEKLTGLTNARAAGINAAKYEWIIFFDDDNEPAFDYLINAEKVIQAHPEVGCWGPGNIQVQFIGAVPDKWVLKHKNIFQERLKTNLEYDNQHHWQNCYSYGTGMIVRREVLKEYVQRIKNNRYTLSDRKGRSLTSGGDVQIVLTAISMDYCAGVSPLLSLNHLIRSDKTALKYILKLIYGTSSSYVLAYNQVFVEDQIKPGVVSNLQILKRVYSLYRIHYGKISCKRDFILLLTQKLGEINAHNLPAGKKPLLIKIFERIIHV